MEAAGVEPAADHERSASSTPTADPAGNGEEMTCCSAASTCGHSTLRDTVSRIAATRGAIVRTWFILTHSSR